MLAPVQSPLLRDLAYRRMRGAILSGELAPGDQLRIDELAEQLALSRTPVREALARLRDEGLVQMRPRSGTRVSPLRLDEARQALAVISAMHELAVRAAVARLEERHFAQLTGAAHRFEDAVKAGDHQRAIDADDALHGVFVTVADNGPLRETIERFMPLLRRAEVLRFGSLPGRRSITAHKRILSAARRGDTDAAAQATRDNWASLAQQMEQSMSSDSEEETHEPGSV
jgi:DNA-binding GntR family transcriptional regulator